MIWSFTICGDQLLGEGRRRRRKRSGVHSMGLSGRWCSWMNPNAWPISCRITRLNLHCIKLRLFWRLGGNTRFVVARFFGLTLFEAVGAQPTAVGSPSLLCWTGTVTDEVHRDAAYSGPVLSKVMFA